LIVSGKSKVHIAVDSCADFKYPKGARHMGLAVGVHMLAIFQSYASDSTKGGCYLARTVLNMVCGSPVYFPRIALGASHTAPESRQASNKPSSHSVISGDIGPIQIQVYPNPSSNAFKLNSNLTLDSKMTYEISDLLGRIVEEGLLFPGTENSVGKELDYRGIYFLRIYSGDKLVGKRKIILEK
jgi:hypothetical protein